jgi:hypothetical protein
MQSRLAGVAAVGTADRAKSHPSIRLTAALHPPDEVEAWTAIGTPMPPGWPGRRRIIRPAQVQGSRSGVRIGMRVVARVSLPAAAGPPPDRSTGALGGMHAVDNSERGDPVGTGHFSEPRLARVSLCFHSFLLLQMAQCRRKDFLTAGKPYWLSSQRLLVRRRRSFTR